MTKFLIIIDKFNEKTIEKYLEKLIYFFKDFDYNIITKQQYIKMFNENKIKKENLLFILNEYFPLKNFSLKLKQLLNKDLSFCYLVNDNSIYYVNINNHEIIDNDINITFESKICYLFNTKKYCPVIHEESKMISMEMKPLYDCIRKKDYTFFYNKNYAITNIKNIITSEYKDTIFYHFVFFLNKTNYLMLNNFTKLRYKFFRLSIFVNENVSSENVYYFDNYVKIKIALLKKNNISVFLYNIKKSNIITNIINDSLLCFEQVVYIDKTEDIDINKLNLVFKHYKYYINKSLVILPSYVFVEIPFILNYSEYSNDINIKKCILNHIYSYYKNDIYYDKVKLPTKEITQILHDYFAIENKLFVIKEYNKLFDVIEKHLLTNITQNQTFELLIKKISIAVLINNEKILNDNILRITTVIDDKQFLHDMYDLIGYTNFNNIKSSLSIKLLSTFEDDELKYEKYFNICLNLEHDENNLKSLFDSIIKNIHLIKKCNKYILIKVLLCKLLKFAENTNLINSFSKITNALFDIDDMSNFDNMFKLLNIITEDKHLIVNFMLSLATSFNPYFKDVNEFVVKRCNIRKNLDYLKDKLTLNMKLDEIIMFSVGNFNLSYQGVPSVEIFKLKTEINRKICPELNYKIDTNYTNTKIKVLFHAQQLHRVHSVYKDRHRVIKMLSLDKRFDVYFSTFDNPTEEVKYSFGNAIHILLPKKLSEIRDRIAREQFDIMVYCEIGMHPISYYMAHMKLAKYQCNTWGHSDTSGIDTIDYYFSSELYELPYIESQKHYSEKLILQKSLCTSYVDPMSKHNAKLFKPKEFFGFTKDTVIYFCIQSLFKLNPLYDPYIVGILSKVPNAILLLSDNNEKQKIVERFNNTGVGHKFKFMPGAQHFLFMNLMHISDVCLDVYPFGGCNSSFEGFTLGKPIVTHPSKMINGRFTSGFYKKMGLEKYICSNKDSYIKFAVKLGNDSVYRKSVENDILSNKSKLFEDKETIQEWKDDLIKIMNN